MSIDRLPTMTDALATLIDSGVRFGSVLDVGVQYETPSLRNAFPRLKHHLFEPVQSYFDKIECHYKEIPHVLHDVALSDQRGIAFLNSYATEGNITHSYLCDEAVAPTDRHFVSSAEITKTTLDHEMALDHDAPYLLKIDVDGHERQVLSGARETLRRTAVVVIEATLTRLPILIADLAESGFRLFDIVDLSYYRATLWQADLVFVHDDLMRNNPGLNPGALPSPSPLDVKYWHTHSPDRREPGAAITDDALLADHLAATQAELDAIRNATFWRATAPLRKIITWMKVARRRYNLRSTFEHRFGGRR